jgi:AraC-like DNA-binding protein
MLYLQQVPKAPLNRSIAALWYVRMKMPAFQRERILPSGNIQVIVNLARDFIWDCPDGAEARPLSPSLVVGARTAYEIVDCSDMADLFGIVFRPGAFAAFAGDKADRFSNLNVGLDDVWGSFAADLRDRLREIAAPADKLGAAETLLAQRFAEAPGIAPEIAFALKRFCSAESVSSVAEIAEDIGWSLRRFSQSFREQVGLSPKIWCRLQRFQQAIRQLHGGEEMRWAELALDCGYYDQSHFANEFKAFSGIDATTYKARRSQWANHIRAD